MRQLRIRRAVVALVTALVALTSALAAHDLFLKLRSFHVAPNAAMTVMLLNGTFTTSENAISRDRVADISLLAPDGRTRFDTTVVSARGDSTFLRLKTGEPGTYVLGFSTKPSRLRISGKEFDAYLAEEGLTDVIEARKAAGTSADSASERYAKHVKALLQVGPATSDGFAAVLGYPAELIPLENPYTVKPGGELPVRALVRGVAAPGLTLLAGGRTPGGARLTPQTVKTNDAGEAIIQVPRRGQYYVKFISILKQVAGDVDYASNWATLTFEIR
jgi:hypothetical protein